MLFRVLLAAALAFAPGLADAQRVVCGPNGCTYVRAPVASVVRGQPVYRQAVARPVVRVATAPVRVVRRGLFGRRVVRTSATAYTTRSTQSYGSTGGAATYAAPSYGSTGGGYHAATTSTGSTGGYAAPPATAPPVESQPTATVPSPDDQSDTREPQTGVCYVPSNQPTQGVCYVPESGPTTGVAFVPVSQSVAFVPDDGGSA